MNKKKAAAFLLTAAMLCSLAGCGEPQNGGSEELKKITVCLDWTPNTNHTGMFVAQAQGYYREAGLDVTLVQPPQNSGAEQVCAAGQAQFAIGAQDTLASSFASDTPLPVTAVAALIQHNTSGIMSAKGQGMDRPAGLAGHTYLTWDSPVELAMLERLVNQDGGNWADVKLEPNLVTEEAQDVAHNPDHAIWVFYGWGGVNAEVNDIDVDFFYFKDLETIFDYYTPVLIANNDFLANDPETAKAFLKATRRGYEDAIASPEAAAQMLIDADDTGALTGSEELVTASQKWLSEQYVADAEKWGYIDPARWDGFYRWLYEEELITKELPDGTGFSNDYLE